MGSLVWLRRVPPDTRVLWQAAAALGTTVVAYALVQWRAQRPAAARRGWQCFAASLLLLALGQLVTVGGEVSSDRSTALVWAAVGLLALGDVLLAIGMFRWPRPVVPRAWPALLGLLVFLGAVGAVTWQVLGADVSIAWFLVLPDLAFLPVLRLLVASALVRTLVVGGSGILLASAAPRRLRGPIGYLLASVALQLLAAGEVLHHAVAHAGLWVMLAPWLALGQAAPLVGAFAVFRPDEETLARAPRRPSDLLGLMFLVLPLLLLGVFLLRFDPQLVRSPVAALLALLAVVSLALQQIVLAHRLQAANRQLATLLAHQARRLEHKRDVLGRAERVHALATLGAVLTHDLNGLFGTMRLSGECLLLDARPGVELNVTAIQAGAQRVIAMADRGARMTDLLQQFAQGDETPGVEDAVPLDLATEVASHEPLLRLLVPRSVQFSMVLDVPGTLVLASPDLVQQVLVSLVCNARDALADTVGDLRISVLTDQSNRASHGRDVVLTVADTGPGIALTLHPHLFDPLFSTKGRQGTGMGLSLVRTLMHSVGGEVAVQSAPGQGATFRLRFPVVGAALIRAPDTPPDPLDPAALPLRPNPRPGHGRPARIGGGERRPS